LAGWPKAFVAGYADAEGELKPSSQPYGAHLLAMRTGLFRLLISAASRRCGQEQRVLKKMI
jgi:hypothetical protein